MTSQRPLFDPATTVAVTCPAPGCGAIRLPGQERCVTCQYDLERDQRKRPNGCLNRAPDPATAEIPF